MKSNSFKEIVLRFSIEIISPQRDIFPLRGLTCLECSIEIWGNRLSLGSKRRFRQESNVSSQRKHAKYLQKFVSENTNVILKKNAPLFFQMQSVELEITRTNQVIWWLLLACKSEGNKSLRISQHLMVYL